MTFSHQTREAWINNLGTTEYDLVIIGGGITGAGIALQASQSGLKVLLIEKNDFGSGTSSQSSKLVHGGLRYLQQYHFGLVATALQERYQLLHRAPHLVKRLSFMLPIYKDSPDGYWKLHAGLFFYDILCFFHQIGWHKMINSKQLKKRLPQLNFEGLKAAANYFDAQGDDTRLVLSTLLTAVQAGAHVLNYMDVKKMNLSTNGITGLNVVDHLTNNKHLITGRCYINATGAWSDEVRKLSDLKGIENHLRNTKGIHVVIPKAKLPIEDAVMIFSKIDKRAMFALPWEGMTLLGTTDDDYNQSLDEVYATSKDVDYVINSFNLAFSELNLTKLDIISTMAGLRPLVLKTGWAHASEVSREHDIFEHPGNLFNIIGGKLTTYFKMAKDTLKAVYKKYPELNKNKARITDFKLVGSQGDIENINATLQQNKLLDLAILSSLVDRYGTESIKIVDIVKNDLSLGERIQPPFNYIWAEISYAIEYEMVINLDDYMLRRTRLFYLSKSHGQDNIDKIAQFMAQQLGWSKTQLQQQLQRYQYICQQNDYYKL